MSSTNPPQDTPDLTGLHPFLRPFPEASSVFAGDAERAARLMHPLVSIDLSAVDPAWSGWIHLVSPIEPFEGYLGEDTEAHHTPFARTNWIGFRLGDDSRYSFLGDWRYFLAESDDPKVRDDAELVEHYATQQTAFEQVRQGYATHGKLLNVQYAEKHGWDYVLAHPLEFIDTWNAPHGAGNWADEDLFPLTHIENDEGWDDAFPLTDDGRPFRFIAAVPGWNYRDTGADSILLFYDPQTRIALLTFDWS